MQINRWLGVGVVLSLMIGFLFDTQDQLNQKTSQCQQLQVLATKLAENKAIIATKMLEEKKQKQLQNELKQYPAYSYLEIVLHCYQIAKLSGLFIQHVKPGHGADIKSDKVVKLSTIGKLSQLDALLYLLQQWQLPVMLNHFSLHALSNDEWRILLNFSAFPSGAAHSQQVREHFLEEEWLTLFPLQQLCYVGMIAQDKKHWAIIKLPNEKMAKLQVGSLLGAEQWPVIAITRDKIQFKNGSKGYNQC